MNESTIAKLRALVADDCNIGPADVRVLLGDLDELLEETRRLRDLLTSVCEINGAHMCALVEIGLTATGIASLTICTERRREATIADAVVGALVEIGAVIKVGEARILGSEAVNQ